MSIYEERVQTKRQNWHHKKFVIHDGDTHNEYHYRTDSRMGIKLLPAKMK